MHGGPVAKKLPARPNLDHLRRQAKTLLAKLKDGESAAVKAFGDHLPEARKMKAAAVRAAGFRLADAQSVVARQTGFANWPALSRHVQQLRSLEGEWRFASLELDGAAVPAAMLGQSRLLIDGDRFRTESPEGNYDGIFTIDVEASPAQIDIEFVEGPEAGTWSSAEREDPSAFDVEMTPLLRRLEGDWIPVQLVMDGKPMPDQWLAFGSRTSTGNEMKVVFGGQTMVHAKVRIDERATPMAVDYLNLKGAQAGTVSRGIMDWIGDEVRFLMAPPGQPRPADFSGPVGANTLSQWRHRL